MSAAGVAGAGGAHAAAMARAVKASGAIVHIEPEDYQRLLSRAQDGVVVHALGWMFGTDHRYVFGYKGLIFYTRSRDPLIVPGHLESVEAKRIWIP
jgi:hypothetical protein